MRTDDTLLLRDDGISDDLDLLDILNKNEDLQLYLPLHGSKARTCGNAAQQPVSPAGLVPNPLRRVHISTFIPGSKPQLQGATCWKRGEAPRSSGGMPDSPSHSARNRGHSDPARRGSMSRGGAAPSDSILDRLNRLEASTPDEVALRAILRALEVRARSCFPFPPDTPRSIAGRHPHSTQGAFSNSTPRIRGLTIMTRVRVRKRPVSHRFLPP
jgi:hypothetical protein